jgi:hypothetical protein
MQNCIKEKQILKKYVTLQVHETAVIFKITHLDYNFLNQFYVFSKFLKSIAYGN